MCVSYYSCWLSPQESLDIGVAEYTDCISAEGKTPSYECPAYDTKSSDSEAPVMLELWPTQSTPSLP